MEDAASPSSPPAPAAAAMMLVNTSPVVAPSPAAAEAERPTAAAAAVSASSRPSRAAKTAASTNIARTAQPPPPKRKFAADEEDSQLTATATPKRQRSQVKCEPEPEEPASSPDEDERAAAATPAKRRKTTSIGASASSIAKNFHLRANAYTLACREILRPDDLSQICRCLAPPPAPPARDGSLSPPPPPAMSCDEECINAQLKTECSTECPQGARCGNQRFAKRQYAPLEVRYVGDKGHGLFATALIKANQFIIEYVGEVLDEAACAIRIHEYRNSNHFYLLTLTSQMTIDATQKGNISRFVNHSCSPNAVTQKWDVGGYACVGIFAKVDIPADTEITFDYQYERYGGKQQTCLCGSTNCAGFLGGKPRRPVAECTCGEDEEKVNDSCPEHGAPAHEDDDDSVCAEERKTGELLDAITLATRRIVRAHVPKPPSASPASTTSALACASGAVAGAGATVSRARPFESFPRALRICTASRVMQLLAFLSTAKTALLSEREFKPLSAGANGAHSAASKLLPDPVPPFLHQILDAQLPQCRTSRFFQVAPR